MSEHIPQWLLLLFGLGSPAQEFLNRWIPERFRPLALWAVAGAIVVVAIVATPLDWDALHVQIALVYAALASGWAMSRVVAPPLSIAKAAGRATMIALALAGTALLVSHGWAQIDSALIVPIPQEAVTVPEVSAGPAAPQAPAAAIAGFLWAQVSAFIGAALVRWISKARKSGG